MDFYTNHWKNGLYQLRERDQGWKLFYFFRTSFYGRSVVDSVLNKNIMKNRLLLIVSLLSLFSVTTKAQKEYAPIELGWIGETPAGSTPVSFGVPFIQGEIPAKTSFILTTEAGEEIPADH